MGFFNGTSPLFSVTLVSGHEDFSKIEVLIPATKTTLLLLKNKQGLLSSIISVPGEREGHSASFEF